jgi:putative ABC transport system permease protein
MLLNFFKIAFRSLWNNKGLSFINIFGLATGIACSLLIFLFIKDEFSYDRFHADAGNIHRVVKDFLNDDGTRIPDATTPAPLAPAMQKEIPELEKVTRIFSFGGVGLIRHQDKVIKEEKIWRVDSSFFEVFTFPFINGNPKTALQDVNAIVLTESTAKRYFSNTDPIGKTLLIDGVNRVVSGVIKDVPPQSHFHFDFLMSLSQLPAEQLSSWNNYNYYTYIKVKPGTNVALLNKKIQGVYERSQPTRYSAFYTQALTDIHLASHLKFEFEANSDQLYINVFAIIGLFILLIAAINYINLSTAKASMRAKEIGIRKVAGAEKGSLIRQFLLESLITCFLAAFLALLIAEILVPLVNGLTQKELSVVANPGTYLYLVVTAFLVGFIAGLFPAIYFSSFKPIAVLKGFKLNEAGALNLRKVLVVVQFTISIVLIIGVLVIFEQMKFMHSANLGLDKEQVLILKNANYLSRSERTALLNEIKQMPGVKKAATASSVLSEGFSTTRLTAKGTTKEHQLNYISVSPDFLETMGIEMKEGRSFSSAYPADSLNNGIYGGPLEQTIGSIILNETAVKDFGLTSPVVGKQLVYGRDADTTYYVNIIGVTKDFHFTSLQNEIKPFGFYVIPAWESNFTIKLSTKDLQSTLANLEAKWKLISDQSPFEYVFLDETFEKLYAAESRFQKVFLSLGVLAIIISCLGLFALATFAAERRAKEIGIRKVLGASVGSVVGLLSKDFLKLIVIALVIAIPVAWFAMNKWLEDFVYRIDIEWWIFLVAALISIIIALLTISTQAVKAAIANPVRNLRSE